MLFVCMQQSPNTYGPSSQAGKCNALLTPAGEATETWPGVREDGRTKCQLQRGFSLLMCGRIGPLASGIPCAHTSPWGPRTQRSPLLDRVGRVH